MSVIDLTAIAIVAFCLLCAWVMWLVLRFEDTRVPDEQRVAPDNVLQAIDDAVCAVNGVTRAQLHSSSRMSGVATARQQAMTLARELTGMTLEQIGAYYGRDHATVMYALRQTDGAMLGDLRARVGEQLGGGDAHES